MQTENEKAVRTLFEQWWNDNCADKPIVDHGYETLSQDIAYHAFKAALQSQVSNTDGWRPIETAPEVKGDYFFCRLAWGPEEDQSTGDGFRWNGKWFAAGIVHQIGQQRRYYIKEWEVTPTHWMPSTPVPNEMAAAPKAPQQVSNTPQDGKVTFKQLCDLLPADVNWSDPITPEIVQEIVYACQQQVQKHDSAGSSPLDSSGEAVSVSTAKPTLIERLRGLAAMIESQEGWRPTAIDEAITAIEYQEAAISDLQTSPAPPNSTAIAAMGIKQAAEVLKRYGKHLPDCMGGLSGKRECTCGLDAALTPANAEAELEALMMDAERYRFLRDRNNSLETMQYDTGTVNGPSCYHEVEGIRELKSSDELDNAVDSARASRVLDEKGE